MAASSDTESWEELAPVPKPGLYQKTHVVFDRHRKALYAIHVKEGLLQYSFNKNMWIKQPLSNNLPSHFFDAPNPITMDSQQNIYLAADKHYQAYFATLHIDPDSSTPPSWHINDNIKHEFNGTNVAMIDDEVHFIGGNRYTEYVHLKYNKVTQKLDKLHDIDFGFPQLTKIKHKLIAMGGHKGGYLDEIHEYDVNKNVWIKCEERYPRNMIIDGSVVVLNQQYIISFGGYDGMNIDGIWIYNVADKVFKESKIKCPGKRGGRVFKVGDIERDELAIYGYIRSQHKDESLPSKDIIDIIDRFYLSEWIHLIENNSCPKHWKINVFDIINDV